MKVILFEDVKSLGRMGDTVKVAPGYFRNYLGPKGIADEATPGNMKRFEKMRVKKQALVAAQVDEAKQVAERLNGVSVIVRAKAGESEKLYGSVTTQDIVDAMTAAGYEVERRQVEVHEPIRTLGDHKVTISIHPQVDAEITVTVEAL